MISDISSRFCRLPVLHFLLCINASLYNEVQSSSFHSERHRSPLPKWTIVTYKTSLWLIRRLGGVRGVVLTHSDSH